MAEGGINFSNKNRGLSHIRHYRIVPKIMPYRFTQRRAYRFRVRPYRLRFSPTPPKKKGLIGFGLNLRFPVGGFPIKPGYKLLTSLPLNVINSTKDKNAAAIHVDKSIFRPLSLTCLFSRLLISLLYVCFADPFVIHSESGIFFSVVPQCYSVFMHYRFRAMPCTVFD